MSEKKKSLRKRVSGRIESPLQSRRAVRSQTVEEVKIRSSWSKENVNDSGVIYTEKTQWRRSPDAEIIMQMLKKEAIKMENGTEVQRTTVDLAKSDSAAVQPDSQNEILLRPRAVPSETYPGNHGPFEENDFGEEESSGDDNDNDSGEEHSLSSESYPSDNSEVASDSPSGVVWRRNPEAEKIMLMLKLEAEKDEEEPIKEKRSTVKVESPPCLRASPSIHHEILDRKAKKTMSGRLFRSHSNAKKEIVLTRADAMDAGLDGLGNEFKRFSESFSSSPLNRNEIRKSEAIDKRTQIVLEIRASERSYVTVLETLKDKYLTPLLKNDTLDIPESKIKQIFGNISLIYNINQRLFDDLSSRIDKWDENQTIGDIFLEVIPYLKIYDQYGNNYETSIDILKECRKNAAFVAAIEQIESTMERTYRIESLLIAPIQRLPRYILLLTDLKKSTGQEHPDWELLENAIPEMQKVADHVDKNILKARNKQKLVELSSGGAASLLLAHRNLISETEIRCENKKKSTAFYLFNDLLVHLSAVKAKHKPNLTLPEAQWPLHLVWIQYTSGDTVQILGPTEDVYIIRLNSSDNSEFVHNLTSSIDADLIKQLEKRQSTDICTAQTPKRFGTYTFPNNVTYSGDWVNGMMYGIGTWKFMDHVYEGEFEQNKKSGKGTMKYFTDNEYCGDWENDLPSGKGILTYPTSERYEGEFEEGAKNGYGTMTFANGDIFDGYWKNNKPDGLGTFNYHTGIVYSGNFKNGRYQNYGVLSCSKTGMKYEGEWVNGFREGKGKLEYPDKSIYDGYWQRGLREGSGKFISSNEGVYEGDWVGDLKQGKGTMEFISGNVYSGSWERGKFSGYGKMIYSSGSIKYYEGDWNANMKSGKGTMYFSNGDCYEGNFKDDMMDGTGTFTYANGLVINGKWVKGIQEGKSQLTTLYKMDAQTISGIVKDNTFTFSEKSGPVLHFHTIPDLRFDSW